LQKKEEKVPILSNFLESFLGITSLFSGLVVRSGFKQLPGIKICLFKLEFLSSVWH
jgi:hypothetical protein